MFNKIKGILTVTGQHTRSISADISLSEPVQDGQLIGNHMWTVRLR